MKTTIEDLKTMTLTEITEVIVADWTSGPAPGLPVWFGARPYLEAMGHLTDMDDMYGADSAKTVVLYFLSNSAQWKGETARAVKAELRRRLNA